MTIKIGDFGLAHQLYSKDYTEFRQCAKVPIKWMPLESIHNGTFNEKTDVVCLYMTSVATDKYRNYLFTVGIWRHLLGSIHTRCKPILCFRF